MSNTPTAFDKPFGENIVEASDALYRACKELTEAVSSLEIARNQSQITENVRRIERVQKLLRTQQNALESLTHFKSEFDALHNLYGDDRQEVTESDEALLPRSEQSAHC